MKSSLRLYWICIYTIILSTSCTKSGGPGKEEPPFEEGIIDPALVGTWLGTVEGSFGSADMTMILGNDGKVSTEGTTELYCPVNGTWEVLEKKFEIKGKDDCDGTSVTMNAPYSKSKLVGNWNASSGNKGTFSVEKQ